MSADRARGSTSDCGKSHKRRVRKPFAHATRRRPIEGIDYLIGDFRGIAQSPVAEEQHVRGPSVVMTEYAAVLDM